MRTVRKILIVVLVALIFSLGALGGYAFVYLKGIAANPLDVLKGMLDEFDLSKTVTYNGQKYVYNKDIVTCMVIGLDESEDRSSARSDMMVVAAIDTANHTAKLIVIPRDTRANVRKTDNKGNETGETVTKLNHSYPYGGGNSNKKVGGENVAYNVSRFLSCDGKYTVPLSNFGGINMEGIGPLTKAVGGVTITLPQTMSGIGQKGETVTLNASQAETYCRARKGVGDGSDVSRGQRQMIFMLSLMKEVKGMSAGQILGVYSSVSKYAFTNMSNNEIVAYASYLSGVPDGNMSTVQLKGSTKTIDGLSYFIANESELEKLVVETFYRKK